MHDLETIARRNEEATVRAIAHYCSLGRWVVASYSNGHIASLETFTAEDDAIAALKTEMPPTSDQRVLHTPAKPDGTVVPALVEPEGVLISHNASVAGVTLTATASQA